MEPYNLEGRSRGSSFRRRALTLVGVSALTLSGVGAAVFGASQAFASTTLSSGNYTVGAFTSVTGVSATVAPSTLGGTATYTIDLTLTTAMVAADTITVIAPAGTAFNSAVADYVVTDQTSGNVSNAGSAATLATKNGSSTYNDTQFSTGKAYSKGDVLSVAISNVTNPNTAGSYTLTVNTSEDQTAVTSNSYSLSGTPAATYTVSSSNGLPSGTSTYSLSGVVTASGFGKGTTLIGVDAYSNNGTTASTVAFPAGASNYTVTDVTSGASAAASTVSAETAITIAGPVTVGEYVNITSPITIASGDNISVQITGMTNPASEKQNIDIATSANPAAPTIAAPYTGDSGSVVIGTAISGVTLSLSNSGAAKTSNYTVGLTATTAIAAAGSVTLTAPAGTTFPATGGATAGYSITDNTTSSGSAIVAAVTLSMGKGSATNNVVAITVPNAITKGDSLTITVTGVTNPAVGSYTNFSVATSGDLISVNAPSYTISTAPSLSTVLTSATTGGVSNWTIANFQAGTSGIAKGDTLEIVASDTTTTFPSAGSQYQLVDLTNSASTTTFGGNSAFHTDYYDVTLTLPAAISAGDSLELIVTSVLNPTTASTTDTVSITGGTTGDIAYLSTPATTTAPDASATMASGALVQTGGTIYVIAGGVAFGIPTFSDYSTIANGLGDPTVVQAATAPSTTGTVAPGTLVQVVGSAQIDVVGSSNTAYGFSTASEFTSDGYSFAKVIQIPSLGNLTVGSGAAPNAASTMATGSLVQTGGTIYVIAGGVAFGIPTFSDYSTIANGLGDPTVVQAATAPSTTGTVANGTLVQQVGSGLISVYSSGTAVGFSTASQFTGDGYSFANVIMIP